MDSDASTGHMAKEPPEENTEKKYRDINKNILQCFTNLSKSHEKQRVGAAISILKHLVAKQGSENEEICSELLYAFKRLASGMGSNRLEARTGFYSTFVTLLSTFPHITVSKVLEIVSKELTTNSTQGKCEKAEVYTSQILVYGALIQSGAFLKATVPEQQLVLTNLLNTADERSYLPLTVYSFLKKLIEEVKEKHFKKIIWPVIKERLKHPWEEQTLETLYLLLAVRSRFPSVVNRNFLELHLGSPELIHENSLQHCCQLIMSIPHRNSLQHPVFESLCEALCSSPLLPQFWLTMDSLLARDKSHKMKQIVTAQMLYQILVHLQDYTQVPHLFTPNLIQLIMKCGQKRQGNRDEVGEKIQQCLDLVVTQFKDQTSPNHDDTIIQLIEKLLFFPGNFQIELITGYKIIRQLTAKLSSPGVKRLCKIYKKILEASKPHVCGPNGMTEPWNGKDRLLAGHLIVKLVTHSAMQTSLSWKAKQLEVLMRFGLFQVDKTLPQPIAMQVKSSFYKALDQRVPNLETLTTLLGLVVNNLNIMISSKEHGKLWQPISKKSLMAWNEMMGIVQQMEAAEKKKASAIPLFHTMFLHLGLHLFSDSKMAEEALQELHSCYDRVHNSIKSKRVKVLREGDLEDEEPEWVEVAVDLLLSLLSNGSHLLRSLVMSVTPHLCPHLTPSALQQIIHVLDTKSGSNPLSVADNDKSQISSSDSEDSESGEEDDENGTDNGDEEEDEEEEEDDDLWDESEDDEKETVSDKVRLAVRQALGTAASLTDTESVDLDEIDEEEGKRLDMALSNAFKVLKEARSSTQKKVKQSKEDETLTHFRTRVVGLLDVVLATEPTMSTCLDLILPLFELLEFCMHDAHQKPLENRTRACLHKLAAVRTWRDASDVTHERLVDILRWLMEKGNRSAPIYLDMALESAECCTFLVRCSIHQVNQPGSEKIHRLYNQALNDFLQKRDCLLSMSVFKNVLQLMWDGNWTLASELVSLAFSMEVRTFRRLQALQLLGVFFSNRRLILTSTQIELLNQINSQLLQFTKNLLITLKEGTEEVPKAKYMVELFGLLKVVRQAQGLGHGQPCKTWKKLCDVLQQFAEDDFGAGVRSAVKTLCSNLGINLLRKNPMPKKLGLTNGGAAKNSESESESEVKPESKRKKKKEHKKRSQNKSIEQNSSSDEQPSKEKVKVKKMKSNNKLRKESQMLRLAAMSEGLKQVNFNFKSEMNGTQGKTFNSRKPEKRKLSSGSPGNPNKKSK